MPGPGKKKQKQKPKQSTSRVSNGAGRNAPATFAHEIDNLEGWNVIVAMLCKEFNLPGMVHLQHLFDASFILNLHVDAFVIPSII